MKIAAVSIYPGRDEKHIKASGVASYTKNLLKNIPLSSEDKLFIVCDKRGGRRERYSEDGIRIVRAFDRNYKFLWQIYRAVKEIDADVVHIQQEIPLYGRIHTAVMLAWLVWLLKGRKTVVTLHHVVSLAKIDAAFVRANKSSMPPWLVKLAFRIIYTPLVRWASEVIVHEPYFKDILVTEYGCDEANITPIPHGVEHFSSLGVQTSRRKLGIAHDRHVVLFMGYLAGYKGFDLLLEGFSEYAKRDPKALLLIGAGKHPKFESDPSYQAEYAAKQKKAAKLIPAEQYRWLGFIAEDEIAAYYSACDVSLYPYIISMSSSGPMAFSIGYERAFLASDVFSAVLPKELLFERTAASVASKLSDFFADKKAYIDFSRSLKEQRLWNVVGERTLAVYKSSPEEEFWLNTEEETNE